MAVTSGFFNSSNGDRRYTAEQFSALIDNLITDGVFATVGTAFSVEASGSAINIGVGRAWFNSVWVYNDASLPLAALSAEQLQNRIDAVVIEINHTESVRAGSIKMVRGTPASTPTNPTLVNTESVHQYPLAYIYRPAGQSEVLAEDITNMIGTSACPFVTGILQTINIESLFAQWQGEFDTWFSGLEDMLDGDQATALAARILDLEGQMRDLAMERAVYDVLSDSSDDDIQDSTGAPIEVATRFSETSSGGEIVPATPTADGFKVGDILETVRNDPGPNWLLCNGDTVNATDYPELCTRLSPLSSPPEAVYSHFIYSGYQRGLRYYDGRFIIISSNSSDGIAYSETPNVTSSWQVNETPSEIAPALNAYSGNFMNIFFANGNYFLGYYGKQASSNSSTDYLYHSNSISGSFSLFDDQDRRCFGVVFFNNVYLFLMHVYYSSGADVDLWQKNTLSSSWVSRGSLTDGRISDSYSTASATYVIDDRLVVLLDRLGDSSTNYVYRELYISQPNTIPGSYDDWTVTSVAPARVRGSVTAGSTSRILEYQGLYIVAYMHSGDMYISYTDDITKDWTEKLIYLDLYTITNSYSVGGFVFDGQNFIISNGRYFVCSTSLDGVWNLVDAGTTFRSFDYENGQYVGVTTEQVYCLDQTKRKLPAVFDPSGQCYKFIKAKEVE